jgi:hypothetical protein
MRSPMRRILMLVLPLFLVWASVACILVCASHVGETPTKDESSAGVAAPHDSDCCPIIASTGVRQERFSIYVSGDIIEDQPLNLEENYSSLAEQVRTFTPAFSPPFERLCVIRI